MSRTITPTESTRHGFSLIELLVVIGIIGLLVAVTLPAVQAARESARRTRCSDNLKQWSLALTSHHDSYQALPKGNMTQRFWTWRAAVLPFVEQSGVHQLVDFSSTPDCFHAIRARYVLSPESSPANKIIAVGSCPSDPNGNRIWSDPYYTDISTSTYLGVSGTSSKSFDGVLFDGSRIRFPEITDGLSNTLFLGEQGLPETLFWGWCLCGSGNDGFGTGDSVLNTVNGFKAGEDESAHNLHFWSYHVGGGQFAFGDGSVHFLRYAIDQTTFQSLATRGNGETIIDFD